MAPLELNSYERLPNEPQQTGGLPWRLFTFSIFLFILACGVYLGLKFGYTPILNSRVEQLDTDLEGLVSKISETDRTNFTNLYSQLVNLQGVLAKHLMPSVVFPVLESNTHASVYYTTFELNAAERRLSLEGFARSYEVLAQQLEAWAKVAVVSKSYITESQASAGQVHFRMVLNFKPSFFTPNIK